MKHSSVTSVADERHHIAIVQTVTVSLFAIPQTGYDCVVWCFVKKWGACIHAVRGQSFVSVWLCVSLVL